MLGENLDIFFGAFASVVVAGNVTGKGILDAPTMAIGDGMVLSNEYLLTVKTSEFGGLGYGATLTVDGTPYNVRETRQIDDGKMSEISLTKA